MARLVAALKQIWDVTRATVFRFSSLPTVIALGVVVFGAIFAEYQNNSVFQQNSRADVLTKVSAIRSRLETNINANIQLARGLVTAIAIEPDIDQERFSDLARNMFFHDSQLKNVAAAPNMIITMVHPLVGNESAIGLDYTENEAQREAALRVRNSARTTLAGPLDLVQGGQGFVARFPVFVDDYNGASAFWGLVAAVIDVEEFYADSGLTDALDIDVAITGKDASGPAGELFYGDGRVLQNNPISVDVLLTQGSWLVSATPKGGWAATPDNLWTIRGFAILAGLLVVLPIIVAGRLFDERYAHMRVLRSREDDLQRMSERLELALQTSQIGVWEFNQTEDTLYWDGRMCELYGYAPGSKVGYPDWQRRILPDDLKRAEEDFRDALASRTQYASDFRIELPNGSIRTVRTMGSVIVDSEGGVRIVGVNWDISEDVKLNAQLRQARAQSDAKNRELEATRASIEHNALHDSLTKLPNRRYLDDLLANRSDLTLSKGEDCGLLHIDLDRFKQINDTLGHAAGDAMLAHAAEVLRRNAGADDFVARIGGDEFVVVCLSGATDDALEDMAARIVAEMRQPILYEGRECRIGVSIGIASGTSAKNNPQQLLINADIALYRAKNDGRNGYRLFSAHLHAVAVNTKRVADEILAGIEKKEFIPYYQGQFDAETHAITGVEALARWKHPEKGILAPNAFIDIAEDLSVMPEIDQLILDQSLAQLHRWHRAGVDVPRLSVNVSARRLRDEDLVAGLKKLDFKPGSLTFELVESTFLDDNDDLVNWNIDQIKDLGIEIEIDDFGTGYASIVSLMKLRPRRLKIDRQLVFPVHESVAQRDLIRSIVRIGASLGIDTVAEGVESLEHACILRDLGCQILQGFALARPMSGRAFTNFAKKKQLLVQAKEHSAA